MPTASWRPTSAASWRPTTARRILFTWQGYGITAPDGVNQLVGAMTHVSDDERYSWLNTVVCALAGILEPRPAGGALHVVLEVSQLVWEQPTIERRDRLGGAPQPGVRAFAERVPAPCNAAATAQTIGRI